MILCDICKEDLKGNYTADYFGVHYYFCSKCYEGLMDNKEIRYYNGLKYRFERQIENLNKKMIYIINKKG